MAVDLTGCHVGIIGGDRRELEVANILAGRGAVVRAVGLPWPDDATWLANRLEEVVAWAHVLIAPVGGVDDAGHVLYSITNGTQPPPRITEEVVRRMVPGTRLFIGKATPQLRAWTDKCGVRLVEFRDLDEFALRNSVPSAEGAIFLAMQHTDITLHGSASLVLGYGRTGQTLALMLRGLGARTTVACALAADRARAYAHGHTAWDLAELERVLPHTDVVFNTIPAPVLTERLVYCLPPDAVIVDLASAPGGTDFAAARRRGIKAVLAPGLPGIVAPKTAGRIVAETILSLLEAEG